MLYCNAQNLYIGKEQSRSKSVLTLDSLVVLFFFIVNSYVIKSPCTLDMKAHTSQYILLNTGFRKLLSATVTNVGTNGPSSKWKGNIRVCDDPTYIVVSFLSNWYLSHAFVMIFNIASSHVMSTFFIYCGFTYRITKLV